MPLGKVELNCAAQAGRNQANYFVYEAVRDFLACVERGEASPLEKHPAVQMFGFDMNLPCRSSYRVLKPIRGLNMNLRCKSSLPGGTTTEYQKEQLIEKLVFRNNTTFSSSLWPSVNNSTCLIGPAPHRLFNIDQVLDRCHQSLYAWLHNDTEPVMPHEDSNWHDQFIRAFQKVRT